MRVAKQRRALRPILAGSATLLLVAAAWPQSTTTWTIETFAGTLPGPEGRATEAYLDRPSDVAADDEGNILVADGGVGFPWVRKVSPDGRISPFAGSGEPGHAGDGGPATLAKLEDGNSVAFDPNTGDVYISDGSYIRRVSADGVISTFAGSGRFRPSERIPTPLGVPKLRFPLGRVNIVEFDPWNNRLYVLADRNRIWRIENGRVFYHGGSPGYGYAGDGERPSRAQFSLIGDLAVAPDGALYIADRFNDRIRRIDRDGLSITTVLGTGTGNFRPIPAGALVAETGIGPPTAIAFDAEGRLHYADSSGRIYRVTEDGERIEPVVDIRAIAGRLLRFNAMAIQPSGSVVLASRGAGRSEILAWNPEGGLRTVAGGTNHRGDYGPALEAWLHSPSSLAFDGSGRLLIADSSNFVIRAVSTTDRVTSLDDGSFLHTASDGAGNVVYTGLREIRRISPSNVVETLIRVSRQSPSSLRIGAVDVDPSGRIHFVEEMHATIWRLEPDGPPTRVAGNGRWNYFGDGGPALDAGFYSIDSIAFDPFGNLYVASRFGRRIRRIDAGTGTITTVLQGPRGVRFDEDGAVGFAPGLLGPSHMEFGPGPSLELFVSSQFSNQIQRISMPDGTDPSRGITEEALVETIAGTGAEGFSGDGGLATEARLWWPEGLAFGPDGRLYFADSNNQRIRVLTRAPTGP